MSGTRYLEGKKINQSQAAKQTKELQWIIKVSSFCLKPTGYLASYHLWDPIISDSIDTDQMSAPFITTHSALLQRRIKIVQVLVSLSSWIHDLSRKDWFLFFRTDLFVPIIVSSALLGFISITSTFILCSEELQKLSPQRKEINHETSIAARVILFLCVFGIFTIPFVMPRQEKAVSFSVTKICGRNIPDFELKVKILILLGPTFGYFKTRT